MHVIIDGVTYAPVPDPVTDHTEQPLEMVGRWYMVTRGGVAMPCEDQRDAEKEAKAADMDWPRSGPHRAVQLVEAQAASAELRRLHAYCQELESQVFLDCMKNGAELNMSAQQPQECGNTPYDEGPFTLAQPTQAQAGAVPLTDEQIEALPMWKRFVGLWPETRREIVRTIERHHGITGEQHG